MQILLNISMTSEDQKNSEPIKAIAVQGNDGARPSRIIAKGEGTLAEKILDIAFAEGVKVRQDKDLTELLAAFEVESPVPLEALHAVSLILERVYAENNRLQEKSINTDDQSIKQKGDE